VILVTSAPMVGRPLEAIGTLQRYLHRLAEAGVRLESLTEVAAFDGDTALLRSVYDGREQVVPAASVVVAGAHVPVDSLLEPLRAAGLPAQAIGDALSPRLLDSAIRDGFRAAWELE
jgi:hypothetical protein